MSSLTDIDKRYLESVLGMQGGYVLDYSDMTFGAFFSRHNVDIHGRKYQVYGSSKAKKLRAFWDQESDSLVGRVLTELLDSYEVETTARQSCHKMLSTVRNIRHNAFIIQGGGDHGRTREEGSWHSGLQGFPA